MSAIQSLGLSKEFREKWQNSKELGGLKHEEKQGEEFGFGKKRQAEKQHSSPAPQDARYYGEFQFKSMLAFTCDRFDSSDSQF